MASFSCHVVGVATQIRLERIVRPQQLGYPNSHEFKSLGVVRCFWPQHLHRMDGPWQVSQSHISWFDGTGGQSERLPRQQQ